ncbi:DUF4136 domain-containing protein [Geomonas agri]|uniref:DUF4136 domain-containing protein n=1 Tax=Geomonas agri TaxID=2873702 RepID=UPI001CD602D1|nr:DUF4136 domain-containing protein [Geomonas agri]
MKTLNLSVCGLLLLVLMSGCATIDATTTRFYSPDYKNNGTIAVLASAAEVNNSLEFSFYKAKVEKAFASNGYTIVSSSSEAKYVALVAYGIDEGQSGVVSTPIFGQTGGVTTTFSSFGASYYTMPTYGIVGSSTQSVSRYSRAIAIDIVETATIKEGKPKKVFEIRTKSVGSCSSIAGVFDDMLKAMFIDFPGENGKAISVTLQYTGDC